MTDGKPSKWSASNIIRRAPAAVIVVGTLLTWLVPGWNQWASEKVMTPLGEHPAVLLLILGLLVAAWWYTGAAWRTSGDKLRAAHRKEIDGLRSTYDGRIQELKTGHASEVQSQKSDHASAMQRLESAQANTVRDLNVEHANAVHELKSGHASAFQALKSEHANAVQELKSQNTSAIQKLELKHSTVVRELNDERSRENSRLQQVLDGLTEQNQKLEAKLARPHGDDQHCFDLLLPQLAEGTGQLAWLDVGKFSGKSWFSSDVEKIIDLIDNNRQIKFDDADVEAARKQLFEVMRVFLRDLGDMGGQTVVLPDKTMQTYIRKSESIDSHPDQQRLRDESDAILEARNRFIDVGKSRGFSIAKMFAV